MPPKEKARRGNGEQVEVEAKPFSSTLDSPTTQGTAPLRPVIPLERHLVHLAEDGRVAKGWPMWQLDDKAGLADGHYSKCLAAASPSGRRPTLPTLDLIFAAVFGQNYTLTVTPLDPMPSAPGIPQSSYNANGRMVRHWRHRRHFQALGMMGGKARMASMSKTQKTALGKRAARARWQRHRERQKKAGAQS